MFPYMVSSCFRHFMAAQDEVLQRYELSLGTYLCEVISLMWIPMGSPNGSNTGPGFLRMHLIWRGIDYINDQTCMYIYIYVLINTFIIIYIYMYIYIYIYDVSKTFWGCSNTMWVVCADNNGYSTLSKQATNTGYYRTNMWGIELEHERPLKTMGTCIYWYWYLDK
jgi:hypothetical protein